MPIPPPDRATLGYRPAAARNRWKTAQPGASFLGGGSNSTAVGPKGSGPSQDGIGHADSSVPGALPRDGSPPQQESPEASAPTPRRPALSRRSSKLPARPLAVLEVINKRGRGVFNEHDEEALVRLCACVESLLRRKAAEVALLWSGMTERSLIRKNNGDSDGNVASSNSARFERAMMRLYSEAASFSPVEAAALGEQRMLGGSALGDGGGDEGRERTASDSRVLMLGEEEDDLARRRDTSDSSVLGSSVTGSGGRTGRASGSGGVGGVGRTLREERAREESELVDLSMNLFDMSSGQLLSLVMRFFRSMGLMEKFQVCG